MDSKHNRFRKAKKAFEKLIHSYIHAYPTEYKIAFSTLVYFKIPNFGL